MYKNQINSLNVEKKKKKKKKKKLKHGLGHKKSKLAFLKYSMETKNPMKNDKRHS
jgi:hypothetical protein